jgi:hypothetical protein
MTKIAIASTAFLLSAASQVYAANDWKVPCWDGKCEYTIARSEKSIPASLKVVRFYHRFSIITDISYGMIQWGATTAISDITTAGGWEILGCSPDASTQDIRIVCKNTDETEAGCDHITQNGAVGTLVRLPENVRLRVTRSRKDKC